MKTFNLPDLGEGLADAEIREWHVKVGDDVKLDQPLVCMETAKAVVEVPSPQAGKIKSLFGSPGDVIDTGAPLVEYELDEKPVAEKDNGSVVGNLQQSDKPMHENVIVGAPKKTAQSIKAMPAVRALAKQLSIDITAVTPTGPQGQVTIDDVKNFSNQLDSEDQVDVLRGVRRAMAVAMMQSHEEVVPVTLFEDVDLTHLAKGSDITAHILSAIVFAIRAEPSLNAWFEGKSLERRIFKEINVGLAVDAAEGLFVPVLKNIEHKDHAALREMIDSFKTTVNARTIAPSDLHGATFTLTNFGMIAGRYATPIIVPPMVGILGVGKIRQEPKVVESNVVIRKIAPLSLSFDHRAVTGGEATRFLAALIKHLQGEV